MLLVALEYEYRKYETPSVCPPFIFSAATSTIIISIHDIVLKRFKMKGTNRDTKMP